MKKVQHSSLSPVTDEDHIIGPETATVTLIVYCDFECSYCGRAYPLIKQLQSRLNDRLRFVFRHFPLSEKHPFAQQAAEAAEAAEAQGQFWGMYDLLFEHPGALEKTDLLRYGKTLGLDTARFERELRDGVYVQRIEQDIQSGRRSGVTGTPTVFVNGSHQEDEETVKRLVLDLAYA